MVNTLVLFNSNGFITGEIQTSCPEQIKANTLEVGSLLIKGDANIDPSLKYVRNKKLADRPKQQTKLTGATLENLPAPCTIHINGTPYECDRDTAELEFDQPTTYKISVESWPYQEWSTTYENQA